MDVLLVLGPDLVADRELLTKLAGDTAWDLDAGLQVVDAATAAELAAHDGPAVVVPADPALMAAAPANTVFYDLTVAHPASPQHLHGRGVWGLAWAIKHAVHRLRHPAERIAYGGHAEQWADERLPTRPDPAQTTQNPAGVAAAALPTGPVSTDLPTGAADAPSVAPVGILIHGGFWRSNWAADLMDALAIDLTARGWVSWNLEYRRPDRNGWAATTQDLAAGLAKARERHPGAPIVLFGHSAGGQLALRLAADDPDITLAVSLAGVLDLHEGQRRFLGEGAITTALGGGPAEVPDVYAASDPMTRLPLASPALLVQGSGDSLDLIDINRRFAAASKITLLELPGDHFDVIAPGSPIWAATMEAVVSRT
ncbi:alpha/beta hydrolase family protein [Paractinoplanes lichenicola]|uniref:Alpha/beta hydrolase n=1 Tax=Paractinoplanes lichenicola TaxID=2802976 RepID=A0ABS1VDV8_9ACTN|nr:alpha/beta hydrolase [Actinoplanes lichenicola]MBL7252866.1 alpha/beta hydrolase [Actinoplanes lichenicola]